MADTVKLNKSLLRTLYGELGRRGGQARMAGTSKKERHTLAQKAARARWGTKKAVRARKSSKASGGAS